MQSHLSRYFSKTYFVWLVFALLPLYLLMGSLLELNFLSMIIHELGHWYFGMLAGIASAPFFFFTLSLGQSFFVALFSIAGLSLLAYWSYGRRYFFLTGICVISVLVSILLLPVSPEWQRFVLVWGGLAGEMGGAVLIILAFDWPLRWPARWQHVRHLAATCTSVIFVNNFSAWCRSCWDKTQIPYPHDGGDAVFVGNAFSVFSTASGNKGPSGDLDVMLKVHGWSEQGLVNSYLVFGGVCLLVLLLKASWIWMQLDKVDERRLPE